MSSSSGSGWQAHVDQLCYGGEQVIEHVRGRSAGVAVTSHRVLVFTPEREGPNLRTVERPNATGLSKGAAGEGWRLLAGAKWLLVGVALAVAGLLLDFEGVLGEVAVDQGAGQVGVGWISNLFSLFGAVFALLDDVLLFGGLTALLVGLGLLGWYWQSRAETLSIAIAGRPDLELSGDGFSADGVERLQQAIDPPVTDDSKPSRG